MKKSWRAAVLAAGALMCFSASQAFAGLTWNSNQLGGSWFASYTIDLQGTGLTINRIEVTIVNGSDMQFGPPSNQLYPAGGTTATTNVFSQAITSGDHPGGNDVYSFADNTPPGADFGGTNATGWHEDRTVNTTTFAVATGGNSPFLTFVLHLDNPAQDGSGVPNQGVRFQVRAFNGTTLIGSGQAWNKGSGNSDHQEEFNIVPLPPSVWAGLATLGGMGLLLVQRRRNRKVLV